MPGLDPKDKFLHVIDAHRWLAASGCAWNIVGANAPKSGKEQADELVPNIDVMVRDCLLLHARALIKFYRSDKRYATDILLSHFDHLAVSCKLEKELKKYGRPVEVLLLHLTDWRDADYRSAHPHPKIPRPLPDLYVNPTLVVDLILRSLEFVSKQAGKWQGPFGDLHEASGARYRDKSYDWPDKLCGKGNVEAYLLGLGL